MDMRIGYFVTDFHLSECTVDSILMLKPKTCREYYGRQTAECCASGSLACRLCINILHCSQSVIICSVHNMYSVCLIICCTLIFELNIQV